MIVSIITAVAILIFGLTVIYIDRHKQHRHTH